MKNNNLRIALVQFKRNRFEADDNQRRMTEILSGISDVDIVLLPEAWRGPKLIDMRGLEALLEEWGAFAARGNFMLITGGLFVDTGPAVIDMCHVIGADGNIIDYTEKVFPSFPVGERSFCSPGARLPVYHINGHTFGIAICIDLFYPEIVRSLVTRGALLIFNPANIPLKRIPMWHSLVTVRAAENTVYTVFANNTGTKYPDDRDVMGHSAASLPYGHLLIDTGEEAAIFTIDLDMAAVPRIRERWPYLEDIKLISDFSSETVLKKD